MSIGIIVMGHGRFATGITSALELIAGVPDRYVAIDFPAGTSVEALGEQLDAAIADLGTSETLVLVDLFGGSPFNVAMQRASTDARVHLVYGTNFGMLLELAMCVDDADDACRLAAGLVDTGRVAVGLFEPAALEALDDEEDEEEDEL